MSPGDGKEMGISGSAMFVKHPGLENSVDALQKVRVYGLGANARKYMY